MVERYQRDVRGAPITSATYAPAPYLAAVPQRKRRQALARLRLGCSWLAEDVGRTQGVAREDRGCPHCGASLESAYHALLECPFYAPVRAQHTSLSYQVGSLSEFLGQADQVELAHFVSACREHAEVALGGAAA